MTGDQETIVHVLITGGLPSLTFIGADVRLGDRLRARIREAMGSAMPLQRIVVDARNVQDDDDLVERVCELLRRPIVAGAWLSYESD